LGASALPSVAPKRRVHFSHDRQAVDYLQGISRNLLNDKANRLAGSPPARLSSKLHISFLAQIRDAVNDC
jgi:hypothetical protein